MPRIDLALDRISHWLWTQKLDKFFQGYETIFGSEIISPQECQLGRWIYSDGLKKYQQWPDIWELEKTHTQVHETVKTL